MGDVAAELNAVEVTKVVEDNPSVEDSGPDPKQTNEAETGNDSDDVAANSASAEGPSKEVMEEEKVIEADQPPRAAEETKDDGEEEKLERVGDEITVEAAKEKVSEEEEQGEKGKEEEKVAEEEEQGEKGNDEVVVESIADNVSEKEKPDSVVESEPTVASDRENNPPKEDAKEIANEEEKDKDVHQIASDEVDNVVDEAVHEVLVQDDKVVHEIATDEVNAVVEEAVKDIISQEQGKVSTERAKPRPSVQTKPVENKDPSVDESKIEQSSDSSEPVVEPKDKQPSEAEIESKEEPKPAENESEEAVTSKEEEPERGEECQEKKGDEEKVIDASSPIEAEKTQSFEVPSPLPSPPDVDVQEEKGEEPIKPLLEKRPSFVKSAEIATSPGGTRRMSLGLEQSEVPTSKSDTPPQQPKKSDAEEPAVKSTKPLAKKAPKKNQADSKVAASKTTEQESINWKKQQEFPQISEDENALMKALAKDMELAKKVEEKAVEKAETAEFYSDIIQEQKRAKPIKQKQSLLEKELAEKDAQIEALQSQLMQAVRGDVGVIGSLDASEVDQRDAKIVALSKKNRSLTLALEKEKSKTDAARQELEKLDNEHKRAVAKLILEQQRQVTPGKNIDEHQLEELEGIIRSKINSEFSEAISDMKSRLEDTRRKAEKTSSENRKLKRLLAREVGEGPVLDRLLKENGTISEDDSNSWRGRAQKIVLLKDKLKRAHMQLEQIQKCHNAGMDPDYLAQQEIDAALEDEIRGTSPTRHSFKRKQHRYGGGIDAKAEDDIRNIEQERRHAMEKLAEEYEQLETECHESKRIISAVKARSKVLENENKRYKEQVKILLNKTNNDDTLVDALRRELERVKRDSAEYKEKARTLEQGTTSTVAFDELKQHAMNQSAQIERQGQLLIRMRSEMERIKETASRDIVSKANEDLDLQGYAVSNKLLKVENERLGELVELFKKKLERAVLDREAIVSKCKMLERSKVELERQLGNIRAGGRKRQPMADQFSQLRDKLALRIEENRALKASTKQTIAQKDEEINILREMGSEIKIAYERAISEMKRHVQQTAVEAQRRIGNSESKVDDALLTQLTRDNEYLREELHDIRHRATSNLGSPVHCRSMGTLDSPTNRSNVKGVGSGYQRSSPRSRNHY